MYNFHFTHWTESRVWTVGYAADLPSLTSAKLNLQIAVDLSEHLPELGTVVMSAHTCAVALPFSVTRPANPISAPFASDPVLLTLVRHECIALRTLPACVVQPHVVLFRHGQKFVSILPRHPGYLQAQLQVPLDLTLWTKDIALLLAFQDILEVTFHA